MRLALKVTEESDEPKSEKPLTVREAWDRLAGGWIEAPKPAHRPRKRPPALLEGWLTRELDNLDQTLRELRTKCLRKGLDYSETTLHRMRSKRYRSRMP